MYVQYTNPAGYPPLQHSSEILAENGWEVLFLGTGAWGTDKLSFPVNERIQTRQLRLQPVGWRQKLHFGFFHLWCLYWILRWRPSWVYASDLLASPFAWFASAVLRIPVVFHEHDSPALNASGRLGIFALWMRRRCARRADACVVPNARRALDFAASTRRATPVRLLWNCPRVKEVLPSRPPGDGHHLRLLYHGSIGPDKLPPAVVESLAFLPEGVSLTVVGYETVGSRGYLDFLRRRAMELDVGPRLRIMGPLARADSMRVCIEHDVGLALIPLDSENLNLQALTGASNKPFDYLACGLALLVSQLPDWEEMFVQPGYGLSCDPTSVTKLAGTIGWLYAHPRETRAMGERGRQRILEEWNYDRQFHPVLELLSGTSRRETSKSGARVPVSTGNVLTK